MHVPEEWDVVGVHPLVKDDVRKERVGGEEHEEGVVVPVIKLAIISDVGEGIAYDVIGVVSSGVTTKVRNF